MSNQNKEIHYLAIQKVKDGYVERIEMIESEHIEISNCEDCPFLQVDVDWSERNCRIMPLGVEECLRHDVKKTIDEKCPLKKKPITISYKGKENDNL